MKIRIDFDEPIIKNDEVVDIQPEDLDDFYLNASDFDKNNLFFVLLASLHYYEDTDDTVKAAQRV